MGLAAASLPAWGMPIAGSIDHGQFHVLLSFDEDGFDTPPSTALNLTGTAYPLFASAPQIVELPQQRDSEDDFTDEPVRMGLTGDEQSWDRAFFVLHDDPQHWLGNAPSETDVRSFYRFFAHDRWGSNFVPSSLLDAPLEELAPATNVTVLFATDVDHDGHNELWMTYRLMWGELGRMVWEADDNGAWVNLANRCFNCD
ncbi:MAG: hypothetical protein COX57_03090 [Alphaproteobacteria bacterium CG_4_10_14_0_2_um_filter_63_37]|nr:MAG: hypothetical protein AUJ55_03550 [Proteobacteria bacterium CG1_02_64_396]PJA25523.1 MAG: hypothetical protein COX57_03090 [Alphaproteobacteria bacterium CG_4_10_14_0_2_um_filter_63_37]